VLRYVVRVAERTASRVRWTAGAPVLTAPRAVVATKSAQAMKTRATVPWTAAARSVISAAGSYNVTIEEDWYLDSERRHQTEQVGYIIFE
jgi:hypothetical protein